MTKEELIKKIDKSENGHYKPEGTGFDFYFGDNNEIICFVDGYSSGIFNTFNLWKSSDFNAWYGNTLYSGQGLKDRLLNFAAMLDFLGIDHCIAVKDSQLSDYNISKDKNESVPMVSSQELILTGKVDAYERLLQPFRELKS